MPFSIIYSPINPDIADVFLDDEILQLIKNFIMMSKEKEFSLVINKRINKGLNTLYLRYSS